MRESLHVPSGRVGRTKIPPALTLLEERLALYQDLLHMAEALELKWAEVVLRVVSLAREKLKDLFAQVLSQGLSVGLIRHAGSLGGHGIIHGEFLLQVEDVTL